MRTWLIMALFACVAGCNSGAVRTPGEPQYLIDTHIHIYDTSRTGGVPWPPESDKEIYAPHLPADFVKVAKAHGVTGVVIVEASPLPQDNRWILDSTKDDPLFVAVVGNLTPGEPDFVAKLEALAKDPRFVGIRPRGPEVVNLTEPHRIADLRKMAAMGLTLDLLTFRASLVHIDEIARQVPDLKIVINHLASAKVDGGAPDPKWTLEMAAAAKHKNVYCKFSGLSQQSVLKPAPMDLAYYKPTLDLLWEAFGEDRMVFASNWPVTKKGGDYTGELRMTKEYLREKGQVAIDKVFWKNAIKVYGLKSK